jgi:hypothetical protein
MLNNKKKRVLYYLYVFIFFNTIVNASTKNNALMFHLKKYFSLKEKKEQETFALECLSYFREQEKLTNKQEQLIQHKDIFNDTQIIFINSYGDVNNLLNFFSKE